MKWRIQSVGTLWVKPAKLGPMPACLKLWQPLQFFSNIALPFVMDTVSLAIDSKVGDESLPQDVNTITKMDNA